MRQTTFRRALLEALALMAALFALHLFLKETADLPPVNGATILLAFFATPIWGALRLAPPRTDGAQRVLQGTAFGVTLGLLAGIVGGVEKLAALALLGRTVPLAFAVWLMVAVFFAASSAVAYALIVLALLAITGVNRDPQVVQRAIFPDVPDVPDVPMPAAAGRGGGVAMAKALAYSLVPGFGHYYLGQPSRGAAFLVLAVELAVGAMCAVIAGLVLFWEARATTVVPFLWLAAILVLSPLVLVAIAMLDVLALRPRAAT